MKICIASDPYYPYPSGVSEYTFYLAKYLRRLGHDVLVLTTHYPGEVSEADDKIHRLGRVRFIPMNQSFATLSTGLEIPLGVKKFLNREKFDIIHHNGIFPPSIAFFALHYSRAINIAVFHSASFRVIRTGSGIFQFLFRKYLRKLHGLIAISTTAQDMVLPYVPGDYNIIPVGVDFELFNPEVRPLRAFSNGRVKILYLGRLDQRKGLFNLLKAFIFVKKEIKNGQLIVAGRGPRENEARRLARDLRIADDVIFKGYVPRNEVPAYYASCDLYCSPALGGESFGIVLLEAMAIGTPVVAANIPGYNQVIKDGDNGLLCDPRDPRDIADKILKVQNDTQLRNRLIRNGLIFAQAHSWDRLARRIEQFYYDVMMREKKIRYPSQCL